MDEDSYIIVIILLCIVMAILYFWNERTIKENKRGRVMKQYVFLYDKYHITRDKTGNEYTVKILCIFRFEAIDFEEAKNVAENYCKT